MTPEDTFDIFKKLIRLEGGVERLEVVAAPRFFTKCFFFILEISGSTL